MMTGGKLKKQFHEISKLYEKGRDFTDSDYLSLCRYKKLICPQKVEEKISQGKFGMKPIFLL